MQITPGTMVDRYHVIEPLGEGGMAVVYKATDTRLKREVALKLIRSEVFPPAILEQVLARFEREATSLARMQHPNILTVFDFGEYNGAPYLVSEYLAGGTLRNHMGGQIPSQEAARLLTPVAEALAYAHNVGVVHRDVKPANVLFTNTGTPKLADFGIARLLGMDSSTQLTGTGMGMGTPAYMAPEQWHGDVSPAVDVYALGVVFFEMLTGRLPYEAQTPVELAIMMATKELPDPRQYAPNLPEEAVEILWRSLQNKPSDRYETMADLVAAFQALRPAPSGRSSGFATGEQDRSEVSGDRHPTDNLTPTEMESPPRPLTPAGGVVHPTPGAPRKTWPTPPPTAPAETPPPTRPPTYPAGTMPPSQTTPAGFDSGATFQTPAGVIGGDKTTVQTPPSGQTYPTPPPFVPPAGPPKAAAPAKPRASRSRLVGVVLVVLFIVIAGGAGVFGYQLYSKAAFEAKVATGLAQTALVALAEEQTAVVETQTVRQATEQAAARQTEAAAIAEAQAAATRSAATAAVEATLAAIPAPLQTPLSWPVIYQATFTNDPGDWIIGEDDNEFAVIRRGIENGAFVISMNAKKGVASPTVPDVPAAVNTDALDDFYLSVDMMMFGPTSMQGGVVFRYDSNSGYYSFIINPSGKFSLWSYSFEDSTWTSVVDETASSAISVNGMNRIEIVGRGNRYYIYINRTLAVDTTANLHSGGWAGFTCELSKNGDVGEWRFDNYMVRAP